ncbi:MAG: HEAT repeat domain-containing protein [Myxococcaceae bacterium]
MNRTLGAVCLAMTLVFVAGCKGDPTTAEYWSKAIDKSPKAKDRVKVVEELRQSGKMNASFLPMLHQKLDAEKSYEVKASIAKILAEQKDPSSVEPLSNALDLGNTEPAANTMNKEITAALGAIGDPKVEPTLLKLLNSKDAYTRIEAINALGAMKSKAAVPKLVDIVQDDNGEPFIAKKAIQALGDIGDATSVPVLTKMMFKERKGVSFYVESSFALYQIGDKSKDAMLPILEGKDKDLLAWANQTGMIEAALYAKAAQVEGDLHDGRAEKALLSKLQFDNPMLDVKLFVRMRAADALGRIRSKDAVKPLSSMLEEEEATARGEYIRALVKIGSPEATPALVKSAQKGSWDAREGAMVGLAMVGDEKAADEFKKFDAAEEALTTAECKESPGIKGCDQPAKLVGEHKERIGALAKRIDAAKECKQDSACWTKKLDDKDAGVRERAALELGRSGKAEAVEPLMKHLRESNLDTRLAIIQAVDWLADDKSVAAKAKSMTADLDKQIADEKGKTEFVKVNEDLRRLSVKLKRT